jgi:hypothetical protein
VVCPSWWNVSAQPLPLFGRAAIIFEYENSVLLQEVMAALDEVSAHLGLSRSRPILWCHVCSCEADSEATDSTVHVGVTGQQGVSARHHGVVTVVRAYGGGTYERRQSKLELILMLRVTLHVEQSKLA